VQAGPTSRLLSQFQSTEAQPLVVRSMPERGLVVPPGGDISVSPDGMIVVDSAGAPLYYIHSSGMVVGRAPRANGDGPS
jgi:hypothetical protein